MSDRAPTAAEWRARADGDTEQGLGATERELKRELAMRDAFLARVSTGLERRVAALGRCECSGVRELKGFSRELAIITGNEAALVPRRKRVDLADLVERVVAEFSPQGRKGLRAAPPVRITRTGKVSGRFDPDLIETLVAELITNAFKYGARKPVAIEVAGDREVVVLTVSDQGAGVPAQLKPGRLFKRGSNVGKAVGYGVGVWIAGLIARAHAGSFRLARRPGGGTRAIVRLPRS